MYSKDSRLDQQTKEHCKSLAKDNCGVEAYRGKYRLNIARKYSRMYYSSEQQKRLSTGLSILNTKGKIDKANSDTVAAKVAQIHNDLANGYFDKTLSKYGLAKEIALEVISGGKDKQISLLELYEYYCDSRRGSISETTLELEFKRKYKNAIIEAIYNVGEDDAIAIRQWLIENRSFQTAKETLRNLDKAYQLGIKHKGLTNNPFLDMAETIKLNNSNNDDEDEDTKAFTLEEMNLIIKAFEIPNRKHLAPIIKFLFWTGCRTGEAIGLRWRDIKWDKQIIAIKRTYNPRLKLFKPTKTGVVRWFPLPKDGELWNLLKSIQEGDPNDVVFKSLTGKIINHCQLGRMWRGSKHQNNPGVIPTLVKQGKVSQYLKLYATRHTFVSIQINDFGIHPEVVSQWVGHSEKINKESYLERNKLIKPASFTDVIQESVPSKNQTLEQQIQLLMEQNKMLQEIIVNLETSKSCNTQPVTDE